MRWNEMGWDGAAGLERSKTQEARLEEKIPLDRNTAIQEAVNVKATLEIPDELFRRVKARSAMEGRPLRAVAVQLFQDWLNAPPPAAVDPAASELMPAELAAAPWLAISQRYLKPGMSHEMEQIRVAIAKG